MLRVVLIATDPDLRVSELVAALRDFDGERLTAVLVSLHTVPGLEPCGPDDGWPSFAAVADVPTLRVWSYDEVASPPATRPESARARRLRDEAAAQQRGGRLWELVSDDTALALLLEAAHAIAAIDLGGIRSAFHLARRHRIAVATNGLVPCLVELAARTEAVPPQSWDDSGGSPEPARAL